MSAWNVILERECGCEVTELLRIGRLLKLLKSKGKPELVTINLEDTIGHAIELMMRNDFSQLPVVKNGETIGIVSFGSIVRTMFLIEREKKDQKSINLLEFRVKDSMEKVSIKNYDEDLFDLIDTLAQESFILIRTEEGMIEIITNYDILTYFRELPESFLVLNDIENHLRQMISARFDESSFGQKAKIIFKHQKEKAPETMNKLNFGDYITFISSNWKEFSGLLGNKSMSLTYLNKAREIRNKICHFSGPIDSLDKEFLKFVLNWLELSRV